MLQQLGIYKPFAVAVREHRQATRGMHDLRLAEAPDLGQVRADLEAAAAEREREAQARRPSLLIDPDVLLQQKLEIAERRRQEAQATLERRLVAGREAGAVVLKSAEQLQAEADARRIARDSARPRHLGASGMAYMGGTMMAYPPPTYYDW